MTPPERRSIDEAVEVVATATDLPPTPAVPPGTWFGHPRGLATLFTTEMWERFSYYGLRPLLILFMSATVVNGGYGFERDQASAIVGIYAAFVYLMSLPGGWVADRWLGLRRAIFIGACLISSGHICIGLSGLAGPGQGKIPFFLGLILIVCGTGLLKPNISAIVGDLYPGDTGARRDAGFSIFYMGINTGSFFGQIVAGYLGEQVQWHIGMGAAGVAMLLGLAVFALTARKTLGEIGLQPTRHRDPAVAAKQQRTVKVAVAAFVVVVAVIFALVAAGAWIIDAQSVGRGMTFVLVGMAAVFFAIVYATGKLSSDEKKRIAVIIVLFVFAAIFWSAFEQAPTSLNLFAKDFTNRQLGGFEVPATWFQSINPLVIIICAPMFAALWVGLARRRGRDLSSPTKFALGLALTGLGFVVMIFAANKVVASGGALKVSFWWLTLSYFFQSIGELCISPVGLSSMTKLSPRKYVGQMMGIWFLASAVGNLIGGLVGGHVDPEKLDQMPKLFTSTTVFLFIAAAILAAMVVPIRRMMQSQTAGAEGR